ncbi:MAG: hypothetical protein MI753_03935 [Hyphomicrobiales bacterium]|nr:hypothetical protein [Hyphomicrobiales bacterium]
MERMTRAESRKAFAGATARSVFALLLSAAMLGAVATSVAEADETAVLLEIVESEDIDPSRAALLIRRLEDGTEWSLNVDRIDERFEPASSSKIPHTLIALETGLADDASSVFKWDGVQRSFDVWNRDQSLANAYKNSAVWVYQEIAAQLGEAAMAKWIKRFGYGNQDVGGPENLTSYWLRGPLQISAREQIAFLARLATRQLPLSDWTYEIGREIMRADHGEGWTLFAKTGWRADPERPHLGWYVGWVETVKPEGPETYIFAFNLDMPDPQTDLRKRTSVVRAALIEIGAIPVSEVN